MKTAISVNGSDEGVITAATNISATMACRLYSEKNFLSRNPSFDISIATNGSSKIIPIMKMSIRKLFIYESNDSWLVTNELISYV